MSATVRNIAVNVFYYGVTVLMLPWFALSLEENLGVVWQPLLVLQSVSIFLLVIGAALQVWCIVLFQAIGAGTPSPAFPPKILVLKGPYTWCRNPMNLGELLVLLALSAWFASPILLAYAITAGLVFHVFIVAYEEPINLKRFGEDYTRYCRSVNRWIPARSADRQLDQQIMKKSD